MDKTNIFEKALNECYIRLKDLRDKMDLDYTSNLNVPDNFFCITGEEGDLYADIATKGNKIVQWGIHNIIGSLLIVYDIPFNLIEVKLSQNYIVDGLTYPKNIKNYPDLFVLVISERDERVLYMFKEFGICNRIPKDIVDTLIKKHNVSRYKYVSLVRVGAYEEVLNHNDNVNDVTRGTRVESLHDFFSRFFNEDDYMMFISYMDKLKNLANEYFGLSIVKTLVPNAMYSFKKELSKRLVHNFENLCNNLPQDQLEIIKRNIFEKKRYKLLIGNSDFAQSFMTAEWLYSSLDKSRNVDLTPISMGFFKAVEQALFTFVSMHESTNDIVRYIYDNMAKKEVKLTRELISKNKIFTLGALINFLGSKNNEGKYFFYNSDLLDEGISNSVHMRLIDDLSGVSGLRNGFFHKDNISDWEVVKNHRESAYKVFFWLLGVYSFSEAEIKRLGYEDNRDEFQLLCEYSDSLSKKFLPDSSAKFGWVKLENEEYTSSEPKYDDRLSIPVLRFYEKDNILVAEGTPQPDKSIVFSDITNPQYSGVYFHPLNDNTPMFHIARENAPYKVTLYKLMVSSNMPIKPGRSKEIEIFKDGKFLL